MIIEELYRHHYRYCFAVAYRICNRWDMAQDLVQDGFIRILTTKTTFQDPYLARLYVCACIRNAAFERLGKEARQRAMIRDFLYLNSDKPNLEIKVLSCLSKIRSTMTRDILKEIYFHKQGHLTLSKKYEMSTRTVAKLHDRGIKELYKLIIQ